MLNSLKFGAGISHCSNVGLLETMSPVVNSCPSNMHNRANACSSAPLSELLLCENHLQLNGIGMHLEIHFSEFHSATVSDSPSSSALPHTLLAHVCSLSAAMSGKQGISLKEPTENVLQGGRPQSAGPILALRGSHGDRHM